MKFKAIILDFDGTIVESVGIKDRAFARLFMSYPESLDEILKYHLSNNAIIRYDKFRHIYNNILKKEYNEDIGKSLGAEFSDLIFQSILECPFVGGAEDFLKHFSNTSSLYLASISPEDELSRILSARRLTRYFSRVYAYPWIKTDVIKNIIAGEGLKTDEVLLIGDSFEDFAAADTTGISFIGRDSGKKFPTAAFPLFKDLFAAKEFILRNY